jgi:hypothetical protein
MLTNIHHICIMIGFPGVISGNYGASDVIESLMFAELTNPLYYNRLMSEIFAMEKEAFVKVNNVTYVLLYCIIRGYKTNHLMFLYLKCTEANLLFSLSLSLVSVVSSYWLFTMLSIAYNVILGKTSGSKVVRKGRAVLKFFSSNKYGKHVFPCGIVLLMLRAIQLKYR